MGKIYYEGKYIKRNIEKSIKCFNMALEQNNSDAQYYLGIIYYERKEIDKSIFFLTLSANQNNSDAQYHLSFIFQNESFNRKDMKKSIYYLTKSANQDNKYAQYELGFIYYNGIDVDRNINKSIYYLTKSSDLGNQYAQVLLGIIFYEGKFTPRNLRLAIHYFKEASCFNNGFAKNNLGVIYKKGEGPEKVGDSFLVYFTEAINEKNDIYSRFNLAKYLYFEHKKNYNMEEVISNLEEASKNHLSLAILFLFYIYFCGKHENIRNSENAKRYFLKIKEIYDGEIIFKIISSIYKISNFTFIKRLHSFFEQYDLMYLNDKYDSNEFTYFMLNGKFSQINNSNKDFFSRFNDTFTLNLSIQTDK